MRSLQSLTALFCQKILGAPVEASHKALNLPLKSVSAQFHDGFANIPLSGFYIATSFSQEAKSR